MYGKSRVNQILAPHLNQPLHPKTGRPLDPKIRFQGQYEDLETGLYQNLHRYYDPNCGRYLTPDPIGLMGGLNAYQYCPNPVSYIDPLGLSCKEVANNNSLRFNSQADPLLDSMGPAQRSHPAEYKAILNDLEVNNVSIKYGDDSIAFSPNTAGGPLGNEILLPNEFSISALRHEYGHFLDHQTLGPVQFCGTKDKRHRITV